MDDIQEKNVQDQAGEVETAGTEATVSEDKKPSDTQVRLEQLLKQVEAQEKKISSFQSEKDLAVKRATEAERKAKALERTLEGVRGRYADDSDFTSTLDDVSTKEELRTYRDKEKEEKARIEAARQQQEFIAVTAELIKELGVDPNHKDLTDAARGARTPAEAQRMLLARAREIKAREKGGDKVSKDEITQLKEELRAELRKEMGLDSEPPPPSDTSGKGLTIEQIKKMSPEEVMRNSAEIAKLPLSI